MRRSRSSLRFLALVGLLAAVPACGEVTARADASPAADAASRDGASPDAVGGACAGLAQDACLLRDDCHGAYELTECDNVLGYCAQFVSCDGGAAECLGEALCDLAEPSCGGPFVISYAGSCYGPCVRADQCAGCQDEKLAFPQAEGCANDGSVEFCIPPALQHAIAAIAPTVTCAPGGGRAGCDPETQLLCQLPTQGSACVAPGGALTDDAWDTLCGITMLPGVTEIVPTFFE